MAHETRLILPTTVVGPIDLGRLLREAENLSEFLDQAAIRQGGQPMKLPKTSRLLDDVLQANNINALVPDHRQLLIGALKELKAHAPVIHMSFSADPSPVFMQKIMQWLRANVHGHVLVRVGLQPNIGAGCALRTTNKYFDFSLRQHFASKREFFLAKLHEAVETPDEVKAS